MARGRALEHLIRCDSPERDLESAFRARYRHRLGRGSRGFGYWVWKPEVLRQVGATCADGNVLHYVDIGCHLHPSGRARLLEYFTLAADAEYGTGIHQRASPNGAGRNGVCWIPGLPPGAS